MFTIVLGTFAGFVQKWLTKSISKFRKNYSVNCGNNGGKMQRTILIRVIRSCSPMKISFENNLKAISTHLSSNIGFVHKTKYTARLLLMQ